MTRIAVKLQRAPARTTGRRRLPIRFSSFASRFAIFAGAPPRYERAGLGAHRPALSTNI
jgi:hypothetical protein